MQDSDNPLDADKPAKPKRLPRPRGMSPEEIAEYEEGTWGPSRSTLKRESEAAQRLGLEIVNLPDSQFRKFPVEGELRDAIALARRLDPREGRRRQIQLIGKMMRSSELAPLQEALDKIRSRSAKETGHLHLLERWRERLLNDEHSHTEFFALYPQVDAQQLRTLIRQAKKEAEAGEAPKASRLLFKMLREQIPA